MTADLRAALRDTATAWDALGHRAAQPECDRHPLVNPDHCAARARQLRALADAPPTVAEPLPLVDATHEVRWVTWTDEKRTDSEVRCRLDVGPVRIEIRGHRGHKRASDLTWTWQWWLPDAHRVSAAPDEDAAKAAALAALDAWIAEIVDARRAVTP